MIPEGSQVVHWCVDCQAAEAVIHMHEAVPGEADYVHEVCIDCARIRLLTAE